MPPRLDAVVGVVPGRPPAGPPAGGPTAARPGRAGGTVLSRLSC